MKAPTQALDELGTYTMSSGAPMDALARLAAAVGYEARGDRVQAEHHLGMAPSGQARKIRACFGTMLRGEPMRYNKFVRKILLRLADVPIPWVRNQILDYLYPDDMVLYFGGE